MNVTRIFIIVPALVIALGATINGCSLGEKSSDATKVEDAGVRTDGASDAAMSSQVTELLVIEVDGGLDEAKQCERHSDCEVIQARCACFVIELEDVASINRRFIDRAMLTCAQRCSTPSAPQFIPRCEAGLCQVFDVREHAVSECDTVADCALRVRECCECGGNADVAAVIALPPAKFDDYQALVCNDGLPTCDDCVALYPPTEGFGPIAQISCLNGHCVATAVRIEPQ